METIYHILEFITWTVILVCFYVVIPYSIIKFIIKTKVLWWSFVKRKRNEFMSFCIKYPENK